MSTPVVVIGWLLLVPSFCGIFFGIVGLFATGATVATASSGIDTAAREHMAKAGVPAGLIEQVIEGKSIPAKAKEGLTDHQRIALSSAESTITAAKVGAGAGTAIVGGLSIGIIVMSLIGGLIGWLLVMRKKVLECPVCSAIVPAS